MYATAHAWRSEDNLQDLVLSFYHVSSQGSNLSHWQQALPTVTSCRPLTLYVYVYMCMYVYMCVYVYVYVYVYVCLCMCVNMNTAALERPEEGSRLPRAGLTSGSESTNVSDRNQTPALHRACLFVFLFVYLFKGTQCFSV